MIRTVKNTTTMCLSRLVVLLSRCRTHRQLVLAVLRRCRRRWSIRHPAPTDWSAGFVDSRVFVGHLYCLSFMFSTHTHPFNGPFSGTARASRYQKGKTNLDFTEARDSEWQWHGISWAICKSVPRCRWITTPAPHHSVFLQAGCPSCRPTNSIKALKGCKLGTEKPEFVRTIQTPVSNYRDRLLEKSH